MSDLSLDKEIRLQEIKLGTLKVWLTAMTTIIVSGIVAVAVAHIENQTKLTELLLTERSKENQHIGKFIGLALDGNAEKRARLALYFATVSPSKDARTRWRRLAVEFSNELRRHNGNEATFSNISSVQRIRAWLASDPNSLKRLKEWAAQNVQNISVPALRFGDEFEVERAIAIDDLGVP